jgi:hypothetical protein
MSPLLISSEMGYREGTVVESMVESCEEFMYFV